MLAWCSGLSWGIYFAAYDNAKARWQTSPGQALAAPLHLLSAAEAGCLVSLSTQRLCVCAWHPAPVATGGRKREGIVCSVVASCTPALRGR